MKCTVCGSEALGAIQMKNINGAQGFCYYCNACHRSFWKSIEDSRDVMILGVDMSKAEPKTCDYEISIDLVSFGVDTATNDGKKIANDIVDYLSNAGYNVSISSVDHRASLIIDLSAAEDQNKGGR